MGSKPTSAEKISVNRRSYLTRIGVSSVIGLSGLAGCLGDSGSSGNSTGSSGNSTGSGQNSDSNGSPFKLGIMVPMSGKYSETGTLFRSAFEAWEEWAMKRGFNIDIDYRNNQSKETRNSKIASKFVSDGKHMVVNAYSSPLSRAAAPPLEKAKIPTLSAGSKDPSIHHKYSYLFEMFNPSYRKAEAVVLDNHDTRKIAVWSVDLSWAKTGQEGFIDKYASKYNLDIVYKDTFSNDVSDFSSQVLKAKNSGAEALITQNYFQHTPLIHRAINSSSWEPKMLSQLAVHGPQVVDQIGKELVKGTDTPSFWSTDFKGKYPGNKEFIKYYKKKNPQHAAPDSEAAQAFATMQVVGDYIKNMEGMWDQTKKGRDWLLHNTTKTIVGSSGFNKDGIQNKITEPLQQWQNGKPYWIYPSKLEQTDPIWPKPWP